MNYLKKTFPCPHFPRGEKSHLLILFGEANQRNWLEDLENIKLEALF